MDMKIVEKINESINPTEIESKSEMIVALVENFEEWYDGPLDVVEVGFTFDCESAIYWFCSDYHGGQNCDLYSILSTSEFTPGPSHCSIQDEGSEIGVMMYDYLVENFK